MAQQSVLRFAIQGARLLLLPFPVSYFLSMTVIEITDHALRPDRTDIAPLEAGEIIGGALLIITVAILQVVVGLPSLLALDSTNSGVRRYVGTATIAAIILSFLLAKIIQAPQFGETLEWMFFVILVFLGPPLVLSYLLAFYLQRRI